MHVCLDGKGRRFSTLLLQKCGGGERGRRLLPYGLCRCMGGREEEKEGQGLGPAMPGGGGWMQSSMQHARTSGRRHGHGGGSGRIRIALGGNAALRVLPHPAAAAADTFIEATAPAAILPPGTLPASRSLDVMRPPSSPLLSFPPSLARRRRPHYCCVCALSLP
jgi:hypothetical protein